MKRFQYFSLLNISRLNLLNNFIYIFLICSPLLFYFGEKSFIAFDEGYYALQGKWVLEYNNWLTPQWFEQIQFDRPPFLPVLVAVFYKLFGISYFSAHLPILISSIIVLYFTFKIHGLLIGENFKWLSPLILMTSLLWINFTHLVTQDILLVAFEIIGIYFLIKSSENSKEYELILCSFWVGLCFFIKTYMVIIPIIAITPYVFIYKRNLLTKTSFYIGFLLGFTPFIVWSILCFNLYGLDFLNGINNKLLSLSKSNTFSQPFYYYLWNLPISFLPWTPFSIYGLKIINKNLSGQIRYLIFIYPLFLVFLLSLFSTKVPYYALQSFPFLSISASYGLLDFSANLSPRKKRLINKIIISLIFICTSSFTYLLIKKVNFNGEINSNLFIFFVAIILLISPSLLINVLSDKKFNILTFLLGPYLCTSLLVQTGQLNNRSPNIKIAINNLDQSKLIHNSQIFVLSPNELDSEELSEIIKISLYSKNIIKKVNDINEINLNQYVWIPSKNIQKYQFLKTIYREKEISEWVLAKKVI